MNMNFIIDIVCSPVSQSPSDTWIPSTTIGAE